MESAIKAKRATGARVGDNIATAIIIKGVVPRFPFGASHCAGAIWLTYASGYYFRGITNTYVEPAACRSVPSLTGGDTLYPGDVILKKANMFPSNNALAVPHRVEYLEEGMHPFSRLPYPSPLNAGFTNTVFQIAATTNWSGSNFPLAARMITYGVYYQGRDHAILRINEDYEVLTKKIVSVPRRLDYRPGIPGLTSFAEARFAGDRGLKFSHTGTKWRTDEEVKASPEFRRAGRLVSKAKPGLVKIIIMAVFLSLLLVPLFFLIKRRQRPRGGSEGH
jgi:hypothetical protein